MTRLAMAISEHAQLKLFWSTFNLCELVSTYKKPGYFIDLFWRYGWLNNLAIWLTENILALIPGIKILPKYGTFAGTQQICFYYRTNSIKINDQSFQKILKTLFLVHFWSIFPVFGVKYFFWKIQLCHTQLHMGF